jgi:hypothetical protein
MLQWEPLDQEDGSLTLETLKWLRLEGLLPDQNAVELAPVEVDDAEAMVAKAKEERAEREEAQLDADEQAAGVVQSVLDRVRQNSNGASANSNGANLPVNGRERVAA